MFRKFFLTFHDFLIKENSLVLEFFLISNLAFLSLDIYLAHSYNRFSNWIEWIPLVFSLIAPLVHFFVLFIKKNKNFYLEKTGLFIGFFSVLIGILGIFFHFKSHFFKELTIKNLVYSAPFIAPGAYVGIGFLYLVNRLIKPKDLMWAKEVVFLAFLGFVGNLILSLLDHAQNGFFYKTEWIPVVSSALMVGFLIPYFFSRMDPVFVKTTFFIVCLQVVVGILGFGFHLVANLTSSNTSLMLNRFVYGAPIFAPLLFVNLSFLAYLGIANLKNT